MPRAKPNNDPQLAVDKTFGIRTAGQMFQKLRWEAEQIKRLRSNDALSRNYQTINFSVTANTVIEWLCWELWERGNVALCVESFTLDIVVCDAALKPTALRKKFFEAMRRYARKQSRYLHACMQISNATKHRNIDFPDDSISTEPGEPTLMGGRGVYIKIVESVPSAITPHNLTIDTKLVSADHFAAETITWLDQFARKIWNLSPGSIRAFPFWRFSQGGTIIESDH